ncbi:MAG: NAD(P)-dependent alcohol dehydrogenase [Candidatus Bathyarchaeia archaeon]
MKAMRLVNIREIVLEDIDVPDVKGAEVLVKTKAAGVCHSDVFIRSGFVGGISLKDLGIKLPLTLGHEIAGIVEDMGSDVHEFKKGDVVAVYPWIGDGTCYHCMVGNENLCNNPKQLGIHIDGGFAEYVKVPHYKYLIKLRNLSPVEAAPLSCSGITAYSAVKKAALDPSKALLIVGAGGGLGVMAIQIAKAINGAMVIGVDIRDEAIETAKKAGADYVIDGRNAKVVDEINSLTGGKGVDAVIDFSGSEKTLSVYPYSLKKQGKYIMVGLQGGELKHPSALIIFKETQFSGNFVGNFGDFVAILNLAERGWVKPMLSKTMRLEEVNDALDNLELGKVTGRQVLIP